MNPSFLDTSYESRGDILHFWNQSLRWFHPLFSVNLISCRWSPSLRQFQLFPHLSIFWTAHHHLLAGRNGTGIGILLASSRFPNFHVFKTNPLTNVPMEERSFIGTSGNEAIFIEHSDRLILARFPRISHQSITPNSCLTVYGCSGSVFEHVLLIYR